LDVPDFKPARVSSYAPTICYGDCVCSPGRCSTLKLRVHWRYACSRPLGRLYTILCVDELFRGRENWSGNISERTRLWWVNFNKQCSLFTGMRYVIQTETSAGLRQSAVTLSHVPCTKRAALHSHCTPYRLSRCARNFGGPGVV
jgi:hypothetical protein